MILPVENTGLYSHLASLLGFSILSVLLLVSSHGSALGRRLIIACVITALWSLASTLNETQYALPALIALSLEALRSLAWCFFLLGTLQNELEREDPVVPDHMVKLFVAVVIANTVVLPNVIADTGRFAAAVQEAQLITWIALAVVGLLLTEQVFRNLNTDQRWGFKYICLGIGCFFVYDFFLYSNALLFKNLDQDLWNSRGFINALSVPLIAVSVARNKKLDIDIHVSRDAVFHSVTLMGGGIYLLLMAALGYYIKLYGGEWGNLLQVVFLAGALLTLAILMFSESIRKRLRVFLSKHFFSFKYDYREEWLRFTRHLADPSETVLNRICHGLAEIVHSAGASVWWQRSPGQFELINHWGWTGPSPQSSHSDDMQSLINFIDLTAWVIDLQEYKNSPESYPELEIPAWLVEYPSAWLIVPLTIEQKVIGFVVLKKSSHIGGLNWEDHDLLKMAGQQAAILLAQHQSEQALVEARQFEAFNRLSAYTMHDLKNILAQQSLIVANSEKHRNNPAFIDDVLKTVENSVARMTRLLEQMKRGERNLKISDIDVLKLIEDCIAHHSIRRPVPELLSSEALPPIKADHERLFTVIGHLIQNAQEATPDNGQVSIRCESDDQNNIIIEISDTGSGMAPEFIRDRLFKPFDSTKGLTGMGIGAFESRNYIRSLCGDIRVESQPGEGSCFQITLPA